MKLNAKALRYLTTEDFRVLTACEMGSRNHEVVPTPLILQLAGLKGSGAVHRSIAVLAKMNLIARVKNAKYDGYRLTYGGLDYLALHTYQKNKSVYAVGNQIGVGKESDIVVVADSTGTQRILKIHRLGRISFRTVKSNRDYLRHRSSAPWMYMSRLAAIKEYAFMTALRDHGFPVPQPIAQNRHTIVMSLIDAFPLRQIAEVPDPASLYAELMDMILELASVGLIHGDFNEFNILIKEEALNPSDAETLRKDPDADVPLKLIPILIDFPQMVSIDHANAEFYFDRDVECIKRYFKRKFGFTSETPGPFFADAMKRLEKKKGGVRLDVEVEASGFSRKMAKELEIYMKDVGVKGDSEEAEGEGDEEEEEDDDEEAGHDMSQEENDSEGQDEEADERQRALEEIMRKEKEEEHARKEEQELQSRFGKINLQPLVVPQEVQAETQAETPAEESKKENKKDSPVSRKKKVTDPKQSASRKWRV